MAEIVDVRSLEWQAVRPDVTRGVYGKTLLASDVKVVSTRVEPGGRFSPHDDEYGHLFYFLQGAGTVSAGGQRFKARAGFAVVVAPGESHAYENSGPEDLILLSMNLPDCAGH